MYPKPDDASSSRIVFINRAEAIIMDAEDGIRMEGLAYTFGKVQRVLASSEMQAAVEQMARSIGPVQARIGQIIEQMPKIEIPLDLRPLLSTSALSQLLPVTLPAELARLSKLAQSLSEIIPAHVWDSRVYGFSLDRPLLIESVNETGLASPSIHETGAIRETLAPLIDFLRGLSNQDWVQVARQVLADAVSIMFIVSYVQTGLQFEKMIANQEVQIEQGREVAASLKDIRGAAHEGNEILREMQLSMTAIMTVLEDEYARREAQNNSAMGKD
jgi:hypothetical protein